MCAVFDTAPLAAPGVDVTEDAVVVADVAVEMPNADNRFEEAADDEEDEELMVSGSTKATTE
jgi:hypothetical protein